MTNKQEKDVSNLDAVTLRLDAIIRLLLETQIASGNATKGDQMLALADVGFGPTDIGKIVGWSQGDVSSKLAKLRKVKKK